MSIGIAYVRKNEWNNPMTLTPAQLRVGNNVGKGVKTQLFRAISSQIRIYSICHTIY